MTRLLLMFIFLSCMQCNLDGRKSFDDDAFIQCMESTPRSKKSLDFSKSLKLQLKEENGIDINTEDAAEFFKALARIEQERKRIDYLKNCNCSYQDQVNPYTPGMVSAAKKCISVKESSDKLWEGFLFMPIKDGTLLAMDRGLTTEFIEEYESGTTKDYLLMNVVILRLMNVK